MKQRGLFISLEGGDGAGKSTQLQNIRKYLECNGIPYIVTREPGGCLISEKIRELVLDPENTSCDELTELLLFAASRRQHIVETILPNLEKGITVVSDRFIDSSTAYQGYGRNLLKEVSMLNSLVTAGLKPDLTLYLYLDTNISRDRKLDMGTQLDRMEAENQEFNTKVLHGFVSIAKEEPSRVKIVNADKTREHVFLDIQKHLDVLFEIV